MLRSVGGATGRSVEMRHLVDDRRRRAPDAHTKRESANHQIPWVSTRDRPTPKVAIVRRIVVDPDPRIVEEVFKRLADRQGFELIISALVVSHVREEDCESEADGMEVLVGNKGRAWGARVAIGAVADADHRVLRSAPQSLALSIPLWTL